MPCNALDKATRQSRWSGQTSFTRWTRTAIFCLGLMLVIYGAGTSNAAIVDRNISKLCDRAAVSASRSIGVPLDVLKAVARTETGRSGENGLQPWPWTVNMEGTGRWFATLDEARAYVFLNFKNGARSFDVGCFQINYKWHGDAFRSIDDMFDPKINAQYAATFLTELYQEFGNWSDAVGAYHSRSPELAKNYTARFERIRADLTGNNQYSSTDPGDGWHLPGSENLAITANGGSRPLVAGGTVALGSLMPITRQPGVGSQPFVFLK